MLFKLLQMYLENYIACGFLVCILLDICFTIINKSVDRRKDGCDVHCIANITDKYDPEAFMIYNSVLRFVL